MNMDITHVRSGFFHQAMECLKRTLRIRTSRVESFESKLMGASALQEKKELCVEGSFHELEAEEEEEAEADADADAYEEESELPLVLYNIENAHQKNE